MNGDLCCDAKQVFDLVDIVGMCNKNFGALADELHFLKKMSRRTKKVAGLSLVIGLYLIYKDKKKGEDIDRLKERIDTLERQASIDDLY